MVRLGYACVWERSREATWSGTPLRLRMALAAHADVDLIDLEPDPARRWRAILRLAGMRPAPGRRGVVSTWRWSRAWAQVTQRDVARAERRAGVDAVLQIGDLAITKTPSWAYQDLSYASLLPYFAGGPRGTGPLQPALTRATLERKIAEQNEFYAHAAGVFAMSEWLAAQLAAAGVPCAVTVVPAGRNTAAPARSTYDDGRRMHRPRRLLSIGVDFHRKGIDLAADAVTAMRAAGRDVELTVAGPSAWPIGTGVPEGVTFLGPVPASAVPALYASHDVFVLPSRFEPFGIVFTEALVAGLPVVARDAFAMPELIRPGENGALVSAGCEDPREVAGAIAGLLDDPEVFARVSEARGSTAATYSWGSAAARMHGVIAAWLESHA